VSPGPCSATQPAPEGGNHGIGTSTAYLRRALASRDGIQAIKTWPAVSLYLLVAWQGPVSATLWRIAVVFVIMAAVFGLTVAGLAAAGRPVQLTSLRSLGEPSWLIVVAQLVGACGEEFGWRSFLQPHLERRYSPLASALVLGFAWGTWHFGVTSNGLLVYAVFVATAMCLSVIMAEMIRGVSSLAVAGVFHWLLNIGILMPLNNFNLTEMTVSPSASRRRREESDQ